MTLLRPLRCRTSLTQSEEDAGIVAGKKVAVDCFDWFDVSALNRACDCEAFLRTRVICGAAFWRRGRIWRWTSRLPLHSKKPAAMPGTYFKDPLAIAARGSHFV